MFVGHLEDDLEVQTSVADDQILQLQLIIRQYGGNHSSMERQKHGVPTN